MIATVVGTSDRERTVRRATTMALALLVAWATFVVLASPASARPGATGTMKIDNGAAYTATTTVTVNSSMANATQMQFRDSGGIWTVWEPYSATRAWTLPAGDGTKTVEARYKGRTGKTTFKSDTIVLDTAVPVLTGVSSSSHPDEALWFSVADVVLDWSPQADDSGVAGYSFVLDQAPDTTPDTVADGAAATTTFTGVSDGVWYFHVRAVDGAGNWGATLHRTVRVDVTAPVTADDYDGLPAPMITFTLTPVDDHSGVVLTEYRVDGGPWKTGSGVTLAKKIRHKRQGLAGGEHVVEYRSADDAGNVEPIKSCVVTL